MAAEPTREELIQGAVEFLQNPRIQGTTRAQQENYLKAKLGMSDAEIGQAYSRSEGAPATAPAAAAATAPPAAASPPPGAAPSMGFAPDPATVTPDGTVQKRRHDAATTSASVSARGGSSPVRRVPGSTDTRSCRRQPATVARGGACWGASGNKTTRMHRDALQARGLRRRAACGRTCTRGGGGGAR
jgi:hypothetical protein